MNRIAFSTIALVGLGIVIGLSVSLGQAQPTTAVRAPNAEQLTALRKERRDALRDAAKYAEDAYGRGISDYAAFARINIELLNAELDLAPNRNGRIAVRQRIVDQFKVFEEIISERVKDAQAQHTDLLEAKAARLKAEIDLLLERVDGK